MSEDSTLPSQALDQRRSDRAEIAIPLRLLFAEQTLVGTTRDSSTNGVMFTTDAVLRVEVEVEEGGRIVRRSGRLARVQRLNASEIAVAVEFDRAP